MRAVARSEAMECSGFISHKMKGTESKLREGSEDVKRC